MNLSFTIAGAAHIDLEVVGIVEKYAFYADARISSAGPVEFRACRPKLEFYPADFDLARRELRHFGADGDARVFSFSSVDKEFRVDLTLADDGRQVRTTIGLNAEGRAGWPHTLTVSGEGEIDVLLDMRRAFEAFPVWW